MCTVRAPTTASSGTTTFTDVAVGFPETATPAWLPKSTVVAEPSPWPLIVTVVPATAASGEKLVTFVIANVAVDVAVPAGVAMLTGPLDRRPRDGEVDVVGIDGDRCGGVPNFAVVGARRFVPVMCTVSPAWPSTALSGS